MLHLVTKPYPVKSNGQIDEDGLFKAIVGKLKMPLSEYEYFKENYTFYELGLLLESHVTEQRDFFELMAFSFSIGYAQAKTGKEIKMFADEGKGEKVNKVSSDQRKDTLDFLSSNFNQNN